MKTYDPNGVSEFSCLSEFKNLKFIPNCISRPNMWIGSGQQRMVNRMKVVDEARVNEERYEEK